MELISRISPVVSFRGSVLMQLIVPKNFSFALIGKIAIKQSPILCIALFSVICRYRGSDLTSSKIKYCPVSATLPVSPRPRRKALGRACISWIPAAAITLRTSFFGSKRKILTESKAKISVIFFTTSSRTGLISRDWLAAAVTSQSAARSRLRASSCWRSSAIVRACSGSDVFTTRRRSFAFLFLEPFLVVVTIKQRPKRRCCSREKLEV